LPGQFPDVRLREQRTAGNHIYRIPGRQGSSGRLRALDGWPRRPDRRTKEPGHIQIDFGVCADLSSWAEYDATELVEGLGGSRPQNKILIDQGLDDQYLGQELHPHLFEAACAERSVDLELRRHEGYDHGYYFISTFMKDQLEHHSNLLAM
jgi:hypothetical protein